MKRALTFVIFLASVLMAPPGAQAQGEQRRPEERGPNSPRANQGRVPPPPQVRGPRARPEPERRDRGRVNNTPHVNNDRWFGHDKPNDKRYYLDRSFEHGRFEHCGPSYRYSIIRIDLNLQRFWVPGGYSFQIPAWEWPFAADWCWSCDGDDFVIYEDPDHPGWYLLYNLHLGVFVHVLYQGM